MPPIGVRTVIDGKLVRKGLRDLSADIPKIARNDIYQTFVRAKAKVKKPGKKPTYPYPWVSVRQKVAVLYLMAIQDNFPYKRSGEYQKAFNIVKLDNGYELVNATNKASYIGGDSEGENQSGPFVGRYPIVREVVNQEFEKLPPAVVQHIVLVAREKGFDATAQ